MQSIEISISTYILTSIYIYSYAYLDKYYIIYIIYMYIL